MRTVCLSLAALLLSSSFAPLASAGLAEDALEEECDINQPILDYLLCYLDLDLDEVIERVKEEQRWQESFLGNTSNYYEDKAFDEAVAVLNFGVRQLVLSTTYVNNVDAQTAAYVSYLNGVPVKVTTFGLGVAEGECWFYLEAPCPIPSGVFVRTGSGIDDLVSPDECDANGSPVFYVLCVAFALVEDAGTIADNVEAHYTGVANNATTWAVTNGVEAGLKTLTYSLYLYAYTLGYGFGTAFNGLELVADTQEVVAGVVPYTIGVAEAECGRVTSQCPDLRSLEMVSPLLPLLA